jgi:hypothetical protein
MAIRDNGAFSRKEQIVKQRTERRFALPVFAAVALAALTGSRAGLAAEQTPAPGTITTVAGTGQVGFSGDGGPATQARLHTPFTVAVDAAGNVFIADGDNNRVRKVSPSGTISTVAGPARPPSPGTGAWPLMRASISLPFWRWMGRATCSSVTATTIGCGR